MPCQPWKSRWARGGGGGGGSDTFFPLPQKENPYTVYTSSYITNLSDKQAKRGVFELPNTLSVCASFKIVEKEWTYIPPPPPFKKKSTVKCTSIRQAPVFRHLRVLRKSPWKFIILMNEV